MSFQTYLCIINLGEGLTYGGFNNDQERFNYGLEELGIVDEEKERLIRKYERQGNEDKLKKARSISTAEDLFNLISEEE